jgi:hypothetical protein
MVIEGRCHCGNIHFSLIWEPDPVEIPARACTCSFCVKHGGVWTSHPGGRLRVVFEDPGLVSRYQFGTRTADFHICARCGVVPVVTSRAGDRLLAVVNVHALEGVDPALLRPGSSNVEGEGKDARLARRQRHWIADVELVDGRSSTPG